MRKMCEDREVVAIVTEEERLEGARIHFMYKHLGRRMDQAEESGDFDDWMRARVERSEMVKASDSFWKTVDEKYGLNREDFEFSLNNITGEILATENHLVKLRRAMGLDDSASGATIN